MKEVFKNDGAPKAIIKGQSVIIINKDKIIASQYFGSLNITVTDDGNLDIRYPEKSIILSPASIQAEYDSNAKTYIEKFKNRVVKAAAPEENNATTVNSDAPGKTDPEFKHQDDSDYWDFNKSETNANKTAVDADKNKENLPAEYGETPYAKAISLIEDFIKEYEECSEIPTHAGDLYNTESGYNGIYFNSKLAHVPYHFRLIVENDPKVNTIHMCFDPRKQHGVYKASTQRIGGGDNGAYTCCLTFATGSNYKRLLAPGDIAGWDIHNKDISDLLRDIKEIFDASEIECENIFSCNYSI